jgi:hypothetical protein
MLKTADLIVSLPDPKSIADQKWNENELGLFEVIALRSRVYRAMSQLGYRLMTLSLPSQIANTIQIANTFHSARRSSATVESDPRIPPQKTSAAYSATSDNSATPPW